MTEILMMLLIIFSASGFFLKYRLQFNYSPGSQVQSNQSWLQEFPTFVQNIYFKIKSNSSCLTPLLITLIGIVAASYLRDFDEAVVFLAAATAQFASFVFVSRLRQRGSFLWHAIAAIASNGTWYATMHVLKTADAYWLFFVLYILGLISGRLVGVGWAQYVEKKYKLKSDATRDDKLAPGKRLAFIVKERTFWTLLVGLACYAVYGFIYFQKAAFQSLLIVIGLGLLQSFFYAVSTRAGARDNDWYIVLAGLLGGATFYVNAAYLMSHHMPAELVIPYVISTVLGSTTGAFFSMIIEYITKSSPDSHLEKTATKKEPAKSKLPYVVIMTLTAIWIFAQEPIFKLFGQSVSPLKFPISAVTAEIPRILILFTASLIFLFDSALHTLTSRAGNRNHTGYHISTLIPKGLMDFSKVSYIARNSNIPDLIPIAIFSSCLGSLFGKNISERIEIWLQARMDIETEPKTPMLRKA